MPKHPNVQDRKRVVAYLEQLDWLFGTQTYSRTLSYQKEVPGDSPDCIADISVDAAYHRISINIYPGFWDCPLDYQRKALLHEYFHFVVSPLKHQADELLAGRVVTRPQLSAAAEEVTSRIENHLDALLRGRNKFAVRAYATYSKPVKRLSPSKKKVKKR